MQALFYLLQKEFIQIFRNKTMLPIIFIIPLVQLFILSYTADFEIRNLNLHIIDQDKSQLSRRLISKFQASHQFHIVNIGTREADAFSDLHSRKADVFIHIPSHFEKDFIKNKGTKIQITADAVNGLKAGVATAYISSVIANFNLEFLHELSFPKGMRPPASINVSYSNWYNPMLNYKTFMVPGILVMLVTMSGVFLSGMNLVREKEIGTIEQLNVTPLKKWQFIVGKLFPFLIIGLFVFSIGLAMGKFYFHIPIEGSLGLIYGYTFIYLFLVLGMGLFISTVTDTQQQALFIAWFFLVIFILMSGLFTPIESMPKWAQNLAHLNPIAWFVEINRLVLLKGSGFAEVTHLFKSTIIGAIVINTLAVLFYKKRVG